MIPIIDGLMAKIAAIGAAIAALAATIFYFLWQREEKQHDELLEDYGEIKEDLEGAVETNKNNIEVMDKKDAAREKANKTNEKVDDVVGNYLDRLNQTGKDGDYREDDDTLTIDGGWDDKKTN